MDQGKIFLVEEGELAGMTTEDYQVEDVLQEELADHPALLAGEQINSDQPLRWILIDREMHIPDEEESKGRWSLDHLFIDQHGTPTLVEVKQSGDTRRRRKVVAQMLDYAANATQYWDVERIRANYEEQQSPKNFVPEEKTVDEFWNDVRGNLTSGKIRMLFVSDNIPSELISIVEFLNQQMSPAEVLAVEVKQYSGQGHKALVPRVKGQTEEARRQKSSSSRRDWDWESMKEDAQEKLPPEEVSVIEDLYDFARNEADEVSFGSGNQNASLILYFDEVSEKSTFTITTSGYINFFRLHRTWINHSPEELVWGEKEMSWLSDKLTDIHGQEVDLLEENEKLPLDRLTGEEQREEFKDAIRTFVRKCEA